MHVAEGARRVGHKIGLTSRAMQLASKITEPDYGVLLDTMLYNDGEVERFLNARGLADGGVLATAAGGRQDREAEADDLMERFKAFAAEHSLGGLNVKDLIAEGRR